MVYLSLQESHLERDESEMRSNFIMIVVIFTCRGGLLLRKKSLIYWVHNFVVRFISSSVLYCCAIKKILRKRKEDYLRQSLGFLSCKQVVVAVWKTPVF